MRNLYLFSYILFLFPSQSLNNYTFFIPFDLFCLYISYLLNLYIYFPQFIFSIRGIPVHSYGLLFFSTSIPHRYPPAFAQLTEVWISFFNLWIVLGKTLKTLDITESIRFFILWRTF